MTATADFLTILRAHKPVVSIRDYAAKQSADYADALKRLDLIRLMATGAIDAIDGKINEVRAMPFDATTFHQPSVRILPPTITPLPDRRCQTCD
jgi:hypothetical protein